MGEILYVGDRCYLRHDDGVITDTANRRVFTADEVWPPEEMGSSAPEAVSPASADVVFPVEPVVKEVKSRKKRGPNKKKVTRKPRKAEKL